MSVCVCVCVYVCVRVQLDLNKCSFFVSLCAEASIYTHTAHKYLCGNSFATCRTRSNLSQKAVTYSSELSQH